MNYVNKFWTTIFKIRYVYARVYVRHLRLFGTEQIQYKFCYVLMSH